MDKMELAELLRSVTDKIDEMQRRDDQRIKRFMETSAMLSGDLFKLHESTNKETEINEDVPKIYNKENNISKRIVGVNNCGKYKTYLDVMKASIEAQQRALDKFKKLNFPSKMISMEV